MRPPPDLLRESRLPGPVAGVDEAGRGPLAGPVMAAAVILDPAALPALVAAGLHDSKRLSPARRARLDAMIREAGEVGRGEASVAEIDSINVLRAALLAMARAVAALPRRPAHLIVDGPHLPPVPGMAMTALIGGDCLSASVAAASIVAKVWRDRVMTEAAQHFPGYGFERHAGYGTKSHIAALQRLGPSPIHRRSFRPVSQMLWQAQSESGPQI